MAEPYPEGLRREWSRCASNAHAARQLGFVRSMCTKMVCVFFGERGTNRIAASVLGSFLDPGPEDSKECSGQSQHRSARDLAHGNGLVPWSLNLNPRWASSSSGTKRCSDLEFVESICIYTYMMVSKKPLT